MVEEGEEEVVRRELNTDGEEPATQLAMAVADIDGREVNDLASIYDTVDHVVDNIFSTPPSSQAQLEVSFNYEGYRISVDQDGTAEFVKLD